jgi:23S rRNA (guanosine2251-2'-O)-methyltransferase
MRNRPPSSKSDRRSKSGPSTTGRDNGRGKPGAPAKGPRAAKSFTRDEERPARGPRVTRERAADQQGEERRPQRGPRRDDARPGGRPTRDGGPPRISRDGAPSRPPRGEGRPARSTPGRAISAAEELGLEESVPLRASIGPALNKHNLLYGVHAVAAAWTNPVRKIRDLFVTEAGLEALDSAFDKASQAELDRPEPQLVGKEDLDKLLPPGAVHQGVALSCAPLPEVQIEDICIAAANDPAALVVVLDQVTDPHNVGAVLRSAAAFGAKAVIVQDRHAPPVTGTLAKTASGAVEVVPLVRVTNLARAIDDLKGAGFWTVGLAESGARNLHEVDLTGRSALVMGSEGEGIRRLTGERCDEIVRLPTGGPIGSLNVSNAAAVALYEVARRR